jgi:hypothetical protein
LFYILPPCFITINIPCFITRDFSLSGFSEAVIGAFGRHTGALTHGDGGKSEIIYSQNGNTCTL